MRGSRKDYPVRLHALVSGNVVIGTATAVIMCKRRFSVWNCYDEDEISGDCSYYILCNIALLAGDMFLIV